MIWQSFIYSMRCIFQIDTRKPDNNAKSLTKRTSELHSELCERRRVSIHDEKRTFKDSYSMDKLGNQVYPT